MQNNDNDFRITYLLKNIVIIQLNYLFKNKNLLSYNITNII